MSDKGWTASGKTNWDDVNTEAPPPLPGGVYGFTVAGAEPKTTKKGEPAVNVEFAITHAHGSSDELNRKSFATCMLVGDGAFRTKQLALCVGATLPSDLSLEAAEAFCEELVGKTGYALFKQRTYIPNGSVEPRVTLDVERYLTDETLQAVLDKIAGGASTETPAAQPSARRRGRAA